MNIDLNQLIPAFLAASDEQRHRAMVALMGSDRDLAHEPVRSGPDRLLNQTEIAKVLGVHPTTIRRWRLPRRQLGRLPRYQIDEVLAYVNSRGFNQLLSELKQARRR